MALMDFFKKAISGGNEAPDKKPGRNDPCWCGSGKKYKRCHLDSDRRKASAHLNACKGPT